MTTETIPVIDLGPYLAGEPGALDRTAAQLRIALTEIGFYFIVNHGVPRADLRGLPPVRPFPRPAASAHERSPVVVEIRILEARRDRVLDDFAQAGATPHGRQWRPAGAVRDGARARRAHNGGDPGAARVPERPPGRTALLHRRGVDLQGRRCQFCGFADRGPWYRTNLSLLLSTNSLFSLFKFPVLFGV